MEPIYMDHAATTPLSEAAWQAMEPYLRRDFGNPNSVHPFGDAAARAVVRAREDIAQQLGVRPREVFFVSGATEADNQALWTGLQLARPGASGGGAAPGRDDASPSTKAHVITTEMEHEAVLAPLAAWEVAGLCEVTRLHPGPSGMIAPSALQAALRPETALVSIMAVNNEVGTVQPIQELVEVVRHWEREGASALGGQSAGSAASSRDAAKRGTPRRVLFHTDAVQAAPHLALDLAAWDVDLASFSAHKFGGPKGIGMLVARNGVTPAPLLLGGGQERGLRAGTLNVPGIVGMAAALVETQKTLAEAQAHLARLTQRLIDGLADLPDVALTVSSGAVGRLGFPASEAGADPSARFAPSSSPVVAGLVHFTTTKMRAEVLLAQLGRRGISLSAGSACQAGAVTESHVMAALNVPAERRRGGIRISMGPENTEAEVDAVLAALREILA